MRDVEWRVGRRPFVEGEWREEEEGRKGRGRGGMYTDDRGART